ncbi:MAG TPA: hypothetical protein VLQ45_01150 [Thermoanaerobaculia bacterium]|nr:hypothetical protein [Thermoanaerobaculia bacterium]
MCRRSLPLFVFVLLLSASTAFAQGTATCQSNGVNPTFGSGVPYQSALWVNGKCYCGAKDGVSPEQAQKAGWFASCSNGQCVCNFAQGTDASNACCGPWGTATCQQNGITPSFGTNVPYQSALWVDGKCFCGALQGGTTPQQAQDAGWYASCANGKCVCNYTKGTVASNACCKP